MTSPYFAIGSYVVPAGLITYADSMTPSDGDLKIDEYNYPWRDYAIALHSGYKLKKYILGVASLTRATVETFIAAVNNASMNTEFWPGDSDRSADIYMAHAEMTKPDLVRNPSTGVMCWRYKATAEITVRGHWLYGADQGATLTNGNLWLTTSQLTNNGNVPAGIDYFLISGGYSTNSPYYLNNLLVQISKNADGSGQYFWKTLCTQMMEHDWLEFTRWCEVTHWYYTNFPASQSYANLQRDLRGSTYCNYGTGGSYGTNALHLGNNGKIVFSFYGPLTISTPPYIELWVTAITGTPKVEVGNLADMSDFTGWYHTLHLGYNKIYLPLQTGMTDCFFGVVTGASDAVTISSIKGLVKRYIAPSEIVLTNPGDTFYIVVGGSPYTNAFYSLKWSYRDLFYS